MVACSYERHVHGPGMVGVGGEEVWEVEAGGVVGEWALALQYSRPWEGDKKEADVTWTVRVTMSTDTACSLGESTAVDVVCERK